jgi:hypothetical protein
VRRGRKPVWGRHCRRGLEVWSQSRW